MRDIIQDTTNKSQSLAKDISKMKSEMKRFYYSLVDHLKMATDLETKDIVIRVMKKIQKQLIPADHLDTEVKSYLHDLKDKKPTETTDYEMAKELDSFKGRKNRIFYNFTLVKKELKNSLKIKDAEFFRELSLAG